MVIVAHRIGTRTLCTWINRNVGKGAVRKNGKKSKQNYDRVHKIYLRMENEPESKEQKWRRSHSPSRICCFSLLYIKFLLPFWFLFYFHFTFLFVIFLNIFTTCTGTSLSVLPRSHIVFLFIFLVFVLYTKLRVSRVCSFRFFKTSSAIFVHITKIIIIMLDNFMIFILYSFRLFSSILSIYVFIPFAFWVSES